MEAPEQMSAQQLVAHVLARYHTVHRQQLPELLRLARKVEQVHGEHADCPHGLAEQLSAMAQELESHMRKEENVLFPMIVAGRGALAAVPIRVMRMEHDDHGVALRALEKISNGMQAPPDACATWRALYAGLRTFRDDLLAHIDTENNLLFERFAPAAAH